MELSVLTLYFQLLQARVAVSVLKHETMAVKQAATVGRVVVLVALAQQRTAAQTQPIKVLLAVI